MNYFTFLLLLLLAGLGQEIQAQTLVFNVGSDTVDIDSMVVIPIRVDSFQTISGYQGTIRFDTAALEFMGLSSPQSGVSNIFGNPGQGLIPLDAATFSWVDFSGGNVTLPDSSAIINISFQVKSTAIGGDYTVSVDGSVTSLLFTQGVGVVPALGNPGTVRVNPCVSSSDASFSFLSSACIGGFNPQALIFGDLGGTFAVDNGASIDPITGILDLSSTVGGTTYNVTYTVGAPCAAVDTQSIQIFAVEDASFSIPDTTCLSETNLLPDLAGTPGGIFSVDNGATIDPATGSLDLSSTSANTLYTITYQTQGNCPDVSSQAVFISDTIDAAFAYPTDICPGTANPSPDITGNDGGVFSISPAATIDPATGEIDMTSITLGVSYTVTYSFDDFCQSSSDELFLVDADLSPPVVNCQDITVMLDSTGIAVIDPSMIDNGSVDECGIMELTLSQDTFRVGGIQEVTLTALDNNGNSNSCTANVTVEWPTSIKDLYSPELKLLAYPNPVEEHLQLELESPWSGEVNLQILNSWGQIVKEEHTHKSSSLLKHNIHLADIPAGMYIIKLKQNEFVNVKRFIKK
ncbi:MAG: T9SS type A sorting domain-containing protein [Bacteroidia bacterium]|nr:T9SS type A sorting domain-containing protein [Bacteroidia bacterium]